MSSFLSFIRRYVSVSEQLQEQITKKATIQTIQKGDYLVSTGDIARHLFFVNEGIARTYYHHEGKEITSWFYAEGSLMTCWSSFFGNIGSRETIQALSDMELVTFSKSDLEDLYKGFHEFERFGRLMLQEQLSTIEYIFFGFSFMSADEKYDLLCQIFPEVLVRVNLGYIASFLGVSQETLSRVRNRKRSN